MKYVVTLNGNKYEVEVERGQATAVYIGAASGVSPTTTMVSTAPTTPPATTSAAPTTPATTPAAPTPPAAPAAPTASTPTTPTAPGEDIMSPMPGTILEVRCQAGKAVKAGEILFILEAMKMENEICASRDGTITAVCIDKGSTVETGTTLCTIS